MTDSREGHPRQENPCGIRSYAHERVVGRPGRRWSCWGSMRLTRFGGHLGDTPVLWSRDIELVMC